MPSAGVLPHVSSSPLSSGHYIATSQATKALNPYRGHEVRPGGDVQSDAAMAGFIYDHFQTAYHPVGTCKMESDPFAVVDDQLRVYGIDGLRVVDASILPTIIGGHTQAPTVMIAEKAAMLIRKRQPESAVRVAHEDAV